MPVQGIGISCLLVTIVNMLVLLTPVVASSIGGLRGSVLMLGGGALDHDVFVAGTVTCEAGDVPSTPPKLKEP